MCARVYACVCPYVYAYVSLCVGAAQNEGHMLSISNDQLTEATGYPVNGSQNLQHTDSYEVSEPR